MSEPIEFEIGIDPDTYERIRAIADDSGSTVRDAVAHCLRLYFAHKCPSPTGPQTLPLTPEVRDYLETRQARNIERGKGAQTWAGVVVEACDAARRRDAALAKDASKERALAMGDRKVKRRRYQPRRPDPSVAEPSQPEEVREWAAEAPVSGKRRVDTL